MFSIGEFSKITGLTIKTLRFYHERGVLIPARVESGSGYRYYDDRNVETARAIAALRELDFSLDEIGDILRDHADEADIVSFLEARKQSLTERMSRDRKLVSSIDRIIQREKEAQQMNQSVFEIEEKSVEPMLVAGIRMQGRYRPAAAGVSQRRTASVAHSSRRRRMTCLSKLHLTSGDRRTTYSSCSLPNRIQRVVCSQVHDAVAEEGNGSEESHPRLSFLDSQ